MIRLKLYILTFTLALACAAKAQPEIRIKPYTTNDGLPSNYVINMVQDPKGYIWIATHNGLSRFDGYTFRNYSHDKDGPARLPHSNIIRHIDQNPNGLLWIRFYGEVYSCYDTSRERFTPYTADGTEPRGLRECTFTSGGDTWLWGKGAGALRVCRADDGTLASHAFSREQGNLSNNKLTCLGEDGAGRVWMGSDNGIMRVSGDTTVTYAQGHNIVGLADIDGTLYFIDSTGQVLRTTANPQPQEMPSTERLSAIRGVARCGRDILIITATDTWQYSTATGACRRALLQAPDGYTYTDQQGRYSVVDLSGRVHYFAPDGQTHTVQAFPHNIQHEDYGHVKTTLALGGQLVVATQGNGLILYDPKTLATRHITTANPYVPLSSNNIFNMLVDNGDNVWLAFDNGGIARLSLLAEQLRRNNLSAYDTPGRADQMLSLAWQPDGSLLATNHQHQVLLVDTATLALQPIASVGDDRARTVLRTRDGTLWTGTEYNGLRIGDRWYTHDKADTTSIAQNRVTAILQDSHGRVWTACGSGGLDLALPQPDGSYRFRHYFDHNGLHRKVLCLRQCAHGLVWAGTDRGLIAFRPDELAADSSRYDTWMEQDSDNWFDVHDICELPDGRMAYATTGAGIYLSDSPHGAGMTFHRYTTADGLPDLTCASLVADADGMLWIGTQWGLARMDTRTATFNRYYLTPEPQGNVYANGAALLLGSGELLFATDNGLTAFNPRSLVGHHGTQRPPAVAGLHINGTPLEDTPLAGTLDRLRLAHNQNTLTFYASCFDYGSEETTEYAFRLEGEDRDWSLPSRQNSVTYSHLDPGSYTLHVRSRNTEASTDFAETTLSFTILPPLWATWWARLAYLLLAALLLWLLVHGLMTQYRLRRRLELERRMTDFKSEFFMNISHELRTPLTLIQGSVERLRALGLVTGDIKQPVKSMQSSVSRLLRLTNQLLTFNKLQSDRLQLRLQQTDVVRLSRDITQNFSDTAATRHMALSFTPQTARLEIPLDREMYDKMLYNLVSNAMKYTPDGGTIAVRLTAADGRCTVSVADSGIGIRPEQKAELFSRFARSTVAVDSIGIGLNLAYQLARVHHGELTHADNPGGGSVFTITLPADDTPYQPADWTTEVDAATGAEPQFTHDEEYVEMPPVPLNNRRVVLAEDDPDVRDYLQRELGRYFQVTALPDGQSAFDEIKREKPDLIVSDVVMPLMDGIELLGRVRQDDDTFDIPFILLTAMDDARRRMQGVKSGADSYLPKPISIGLLTTRCLKLLEQYERLKQQFSREALTPQQPPVIATDQDKRFRDILDAKIMARLGDPNLSVDELGESMNYRHTQFSARVKEVTGMPPGEYIKRIKMERAAQLLEGDATLTISEVAYKLGFNDPLYFGRCFKQHYGITPSMFRKGGKQ